MRWSWRDSSSSQESFYTRISGAVFSPLCSMDSRLSSWRCWRLASRGLFVSQHVIHWLYFPAKRPLQIIRRKDEWDGTGWLTRIFKDGPAVWIASSTSTLQTTDCITHPILCWTGTHPCSRSTLSGSVSNDYLHYQIAQWSCVFTNSLLFCCCRQVFDLLTVETPRFIPALWMHCHNSWDLMLL